MLPPNNMRWWLLLTVALFLVFVWPPQHDRSLAIKFVNWIVDPMDSLPVLPGQLPPGLSDDPETVTAHDFAIQEYDAMYAKGGVTRWRLELKVARDPFNSATVRQLLLAVGVVTAFLALRLMGPTARAAGPK